MGTQNSSHQEINEAISECIEIFSEKNDIHSEILIAQTLRESGVCADESEVQETAKTIDRTIDSISSGYQEIQDYKAKGLSTKQWLADQLITIENQCPGIENLSSKVHQSLDLAQREFAEHLGVDLSPSPIEKPRQLDDLAKKALADKIIKSTQTITQVSSIAQAQTPKFEAFDSIKEISQVKATFDAKLGDASEDRLKKAVATGMEIARKKNLLPEKVKACAPAEIAAIVDSGLTSAKVAYKVAQGQLSPVDAAEVVIDRAASRLKTVIVETCTKTGAKVGRTLGAAIGSVFGPVGASVGAAVGQAVGYLAGKAVGEVITRGVGIVATFAKSVVSTAWEGAKSFGRSVASFFGF